MPGKRGAFGYCLVDDKIYIQGGAFEGANQSSSGQSDELVEDWGNLWMFDTNDENKGWSPLAEPTDYKTTNRSEHSLAYFDDKIWLLSGRSNSGQEFTKNQATYSTLSYDISNDKWSTDSNGAPADPRYSYSTAILNDQLYILGGYSTYGTLNDVWCTKEDN